MAEVNWHQSLSHTHTDLTSSVMLMLDTHGEETLVAPRRLQLNQIHPTINYSAKSWHWKARGKKTKLCPHRDAKQYMKNQHTRHTGICLPRHCSTRSSGIWEHTRNRCNGVCQTGVQLCAIATMIVDDVPSSKEGAVISWRKPVGLCG